MKPLDLPEVALSDSAALICIEGWMDRTVNSNEWEGRTGRGWAAEWRRTDRSFGGLTEHLLRRTRDLNFSQVLDIGCGAGELSLAIARTYPETSVIGVDISPQLIDVSRNRGANLLNASFELADAARWAPDDGFAPDYLISRHGVMFFSDPVGAFTHLAKLAVPGANMLFSCFRGPSANEIFTSVASLLPTPPAKSAPNAPGPMAFADPDRVRGILSDAGWSAIEFEPFDFAMVAGSGEDPVEDAVAYFSVIGPVAAAMAEMPPAEKDAFRDRLRSFVAPRQVDGVVAFGAGAWIVSAIRG